MGKDKPHRFVQAEQPFLVLHDQVVGIHIIGQLRFAVDLSFHKAGFFALLFVDRKIPLVGLVHVNAVQIMQIGVIAKLALHLAHNVFVLLLEHFGILAVAAIVVVAVI